MDFTATEIVSGSNLKKNRRGHKWNITRSGPAAAGREEHFYFVRGARAAGRESMSIRPMMPGSFGDREA